MIPREAIEAAHEVACHTMLEDCLEYGGNCTRALEAALPFLASAAKQPQRNSPTDWPDIPTVRAALKEAEDHQ